MFSTIVAWIAFTLSSAVLLVSIVAELTMSSIERELRYGLRWNRIAVITAIWVGSGVYLFG